jgi:hypothetical protein
MASNSQDADFVGEILTDVRQQIAVDDDVLSETKTRRNLVKRVARKFDGALKTFDSGSVAHGTTNKPISDADCGVVLDRRTYPELGPDGEDEEPNEIVGEMADFVIDGVQEEYPDAEQAVGKRSIVIEFNEPMEDSSSDVDDQDPSVDLILALTRAEGSDGRWIPNTEDRCWDASDPEKHTTLLYGPAKGERVHRARVIRLAKAAVKQDEKPVVSSFNLEALALEHVSSEDSIAESLAELFQRGADDLERGDTPDPAEVSDPIKLPDGITRTEAVSRLREFGDAIEAAIEHTDDEARVREELTKVFPDCVEASTPSGKEALASALIAGNSVKVGAAVGAGGAGLKRTAAYSSRA